MSKLVVSPESDPATTLLATTDPAEIVLALAKHGVVFERWDAEEALAALGYKSPTAMANAIGVSSSTLRRAIAGDIAPGERLIAALLAHTGRSFGHLFRITK